MFLGAGVILRWTTLDAAAEAALVTFGADIVRLCPVHWTSQHYIVNDHSGIDRPILPIAVKGSPSFLQR